MTTTRKKDIENIDDIKYLVDTFYDKVRVDSLLGPVFLARIHDWQPHLEIMYRFWNAALFGVRGYVGNPFARHAALPLEAEHFEQWINLFYATIDDRFEGLIADEAKRRAMIMAHTFYGRIHAGKEKALHDLPAIRKAP
ncbi:group III truncated hemoglobin [Fulvivirgaceae bacterium PWU5]|uniref:Group III truncated hemoglobin n=1 Tax=Dawidia cretensis TaxID=2782350 RepID=A0AAP2GV28_9BACT|nr:group III truncated hemoglobin [Dawidia cretensis]MBT1709755.1 group III truncated hemoglobin [Dawidia cretensis]